MSQQQSVSYAIVFNGQIIDGFQIISVKAHLAKMLKASPEKISALFSGKPVVIKRTTNKQTAIKYSIALKKVGVDVKIKITRKEAVTTKPLPKPTQAAIVTTPGSPSFQSPAHRSIVNLAILGSATDFTLAENAGDLFEPIEKETPVVIKVDNIHLASNDGSPIAEPRQLNTKVEAPAFSLDAPGAILETRKEEVLRVEPDVSSISLAFPGADLLHPDEIEAGPEPIVPDVSYIKLVATKATFDLG